MNYLDETFLGNHDKDYQNQWCTATKLYWIPEDIDFSSDKSDFEKLCEEEKELIKRILAFFLISDSIIADNATEFSSTTRDIALKSFYRNQASMEDTHNKTYSDMVKTLFSDNDFNYIYEILNWVSINKKRDFTVYATSSKDLGEKIFTFGCIEAVFFSASFVIPMWYRTKGLLPGITKGNQYIMRDEFLHWSTAALRIRKEYNDIDHHNRFMTIANQVIDLEMEYCKEILPNDISDLTLFKLKQYVLYTINKYLKYCDMPYDELTNPFSFGDINDMIIKTNFFESTPTTYSMSINEIDFNFE